MSDAEAPIILKEAKQIKALLAAADSPRATQADREALRVAFEAIPDLMERMGNLATYALHQLIDTTARTRYSRRAAMRQKVTAIAVALTLASDGPLERLLIEAVCMAWLRLQVAELQFTATVHAKEGCTLTKAEHQDRMLDQAQRCYLRAIESLARVRRLAVPVLVQNVAQAGGVQQVNIGTGE